MTDSIRSRRLDALREVFHTRDLPELGQGLRAGVLACDDVVARVRAACVDLGLGAEAMERLVAAALLYHDHDNEAHDRVQDMTDAEGALIHAIIHRREPDYWNAKYWFRRVGDHGVYRRLAEVSAGLAEGDARGTARMLTLSGTLDPLAMVDACESVRRAAPGDPVVVFLRRVQQAEFEGLVEHLAGVR